MAIISNATTIADAGSFSVHLGAMTLIKTITASNSSTISFVHGSSSVVFDSTYPIYKFELINMNKQGGLDSYPKDFFDQSQVQAMDFLDLSKKRNK